MLQLKQLLKKFSQFDCHCESNVFGWMWQSVSVEYAIAKDCHVVKNTPRNDSSFQKQFAGYKC